jgi:tetratricopeptide (TPR) repeat protein
VLNFHRIPLALLPLLVCAVAPPPELARGLSSQATLVLPGAAPSPWTEVRAGDTPGASVAEVPRQETAQAQITYAARLKGQLKSEARAETKGESGGASSGRDGTAQDEAEHAALRARAIAAYRAVRVLWPEDPEACAEASFRAGELLRAAKSHDEALQEFEIAREKGSADGYGSRARLELAHLLRRLKQNERALAEFEALVGLSKAPQDRRDEAGLWAGRVQHDSGQRAQACRTWQRLAGQAADPIDRIQAWDWLVQDLVEAADLEGAAGMLERAREALGDVAAEETKLGERVRNALQRMRSVDLLQRAIEQRRSKSAETTPRVVKS